jgi:hypothetical protein
MAPSRVMFLNGRGPPGAVGYGFDHVTHVEDDLVAVLEFHEQGVVVVGYDPSILLTERVPPSIGG